MANISTNTLTVLGLKDPETFSEAFSKAMISAYRDKVREHPDKDKISSDADVDNLWILYPDDDISEGGSQEVDLNAPRFMFEANWPPPIEELTVVSELFPELTFCMNWAKYIDGEEWPRGAIVVKDGQQVEYCKRQGNNYDMFDDFCFPFVPLLRDNLPCTLAQRAYLRLDDAIEVVRKVQRVLPDSSSGPNQQKTAEMRARVDALLDSMQSQIDKLDFDGVLEG
jgi:hypothetical protein